MKNKRSDVHLLLTILIVFSASVGFLHGRKIGKTLATHIDVSNATTQGVATLSLDEAYDYLHSLIQSRNISSLANVIAQFRPQAAKDLVERIMLDKAVPLTDEEKLSLLFAVTLEYQGKKRAQYSLFDLLFMHQDIQKNLSPLLVAARSLYAEVIPTSISSIKERRKNRAYQAYKNFLGNQINQALTRAVTDNDVKALDVMMSKKVRIAQKKASNLLWLAVSGKKDTAFVPFLIRRAHADVNFVGDGKRTLLIKGAENNHPQMVRALLEEDAKVDLVIDPAVGSALQIAIARKYVEVELLLRKDGGRE